MINLKQTLNSLVLFACVALTSCGYVSDKPVDNIDLYKSAQLQSCKIDVSRLSEIFKTDQKDQIRCIQENFVQFTKYVRAKNPGAISEVELNVFVNRFFRDQSESIVKGLSLIFQINMLLLRDEADRISNNNISPLFDLLVQANQEAIVITQILKAMDDDKNQKQFWVLREQFNASVTRFADFTLKIVAKCPGLQQKLNLRNFILDAGKKLGNIDIETNTIDSLIFLKPILAGGNKIDITSDELNTLIGKLPSILTLGFDVLYAKESNFESVAEHNRFQLSNVREIYKIVEFNQDDFQLLTIDQMLSILSKFTKDNETFAKTDLSKFKPSISLLKTKLIGGDKDSFYLSDFKHLLDMGLDLFEIRYFDTAAYDIHSDVLSKPYDITNLERIKTACPLIQMMLKEIKMVS